MMLIHHRPASRPSDPATTQGVVISQPMLVTNVFSNALCSTATWSEFNWISPTWLTACGSWLATNLARALAHSCSTGMTFCMSFLQFIKSLKTQEGSIYPTVSQPSTFSGLFNANLMGQPCKTLRTGDEYTSTRGYMFSAISSILVTLFQLRPVAEVPSARSMAAHGNLDRPWPLGK